MAVNPPASRPAVWLTERPRPRNLMTWSARVADRLGDNRAAQSAFGRNSDLTQPCRWPGVASFRPLASPMSRLRRPLVQRHRPLARPRSANPAASGRETTAAVSRMPGKLCRSDLPRAVRLYPPKLSYMTGRHWFPGIPCVGKEFASARTSNLIMTGGDPTVHTAHLFTNGGACCGAVSAPVYGFFSPLKKVVLGTMLRSEPGFPS